MTDQHRIRTAGGISLITAGTGDPILLLHGIGGSAESCSRAAQLLAQGGRQAFAWDAPGYGQSDDPAGPIDLSATVIELLDELNLDRVVLFGTSWGGVIATRVALEHPERVRALVLADSTRGSGITVERAAGMRARVVDLERLGAVEFAAGRAPKLVAPNAAPATAEAVRSTMAQVRVPGYSMAADFMAETDHGPRLAEVDVPTLVLVGEYDVITGVDESRLLAERIPGAAFTLIADAGHSAVTERPDAVVAAIEDFLEQQ
ncbi:alpha/beta fold hydrolase [Enemella sp. A6]|uniref:alpha/beta fold hydrolase n=1 Tax=Enemella sp. A6 TaxID=3440152 RepID=UPI003EBB3AFB